VRLSLQFGSGGWKPSLSLRAALEGSSEEGEENEGLSIDDSGSSSPIRLPE
jgi:hypothetical protein